MRKRRKRGARRPIASRLRLQPRDLELLSFVGRSGVAELPCLARLFWGPSSSAKVAAARRVRILGDHGLVATTVVGLHEPNRVTLTQQGADWIGAKISEGLVLRTRVRATTIHADHSIAIGRVWAAIELRLRTARRLGLVRFVTEAEVRRALVELRGALIPDGVALIGAAEVDVHGPPAVSIALEVDLGNERVEVVAAKAARYSPHLEGAPLYGIPVHALLVAARGLARLRRLAGAFAPFSSARASYFLDLDTLDESTVLDRLATVSSLASEPPAQAAEAFATTLLGAASVLTS